jgi:hypothetical protein
MTKVHWLGQPEEHDYAAAEHYLSLLSSRTLAHHTAQNLKNASLEDTRQAKDILRASRLPLLDETNAHVANDLKKIKAGVRLSPILLVRGFGPLGNPLEIADGYHRVCASYHCDENTEIPCRIGDWGSD